MTLATRIVSVIIATISVIWIVRSLRSEKLTFPFAVSWLAIVGAVVVLAVGGNYVLHPIARVTGVHDPPNLLFMAASVVLLVLCAHLSRQVASLDRRLRSLSQRYADEHVEKPSEESPTEDADEDADASEYKSIASPSGTHEVPSRETSRPGAR